MGILVDHQKRYASSSFARSIEYEESPLLKRGKGEKRKKKLYLREHIPAPWLVRESIADFFFPTQLDVLVFLAKKEVSL